MSRSETYREMMRAGTFLPVTFVRELWLRLRGRKIRPHQRARIVGLNNITTNAMLEIGTRYVGFTAPTDRTWVNVQGAMEIRDYFYLGRGCRVDVGPQGRLILHGGRATANTTFIATHHVEIGRGCTISWGVEFLDTDFHTLEFEGREDRDPSIIIGERVWIGSYAKILKGVRLGNNCVIAANSVVTKSFEGDNLLIGGSPAKILRENVNWR